DLPSDNPDPLGSIRDAVRMVNSAALDSLLLRYYPLNNMVFVEGDTFIMGCLPGDKNCSDDETPYPAEVSTFKMAKTETTWWQYFLFCKATGHEYFSHSWGMYGDNPVVNVDWYDAVQYANWASEQCNLKPAYMINSTQQDPTNESGSRKNWLIKPDPTANGFRLPTETEWEFAARGGKRHSPFIYSGGNNLNDVAWFGENSGSRTHPVGTKNANALGLSDMSGNVWEWCWDWHGDYLEALDKDYKGTESGISSGGEKKQPNQARGKDYQGAESGWYRIVRGGSWDYVAEYCRTAYRYRNLPDYRRVNYGFRLVSRP
ncbi:MAG: formylglycine-generating enzyme family protein, partial [Bacteroidota bacterium]